MSLTRLAIQKLDKLAYKCYTISMNKLNKKNQINKGGIGIFATFIVLVIFSTFLTLPNDAEARIYTYYQPAPFSDSPDDDSDYYNNDSYYSYNSYNNSNTPKQNPLPYINSITPDSVTVKAQIIKVTINGSGFTQSSTVRFDGQPRTVSYINSGRLVVQLNEADVVKSGRYYITVINDAPGGGFSNPVSFVVNKPTTAVNSTSQSNQNNSAYGASAITGYEDSSSFQEVNDSSTVNRDSYRSLTSNAVFGSNGFLPTGILQWILFIILVLAIVFVWRRFFGNTAKYHSTPLKHA